MQLLLHYTLLDTSVFVPRSGCTIFKIALMDHLIDKNLHSKKVTKIRTIEHATLPAGPIGERGGVDGAIRSAAFWPIMVIVKTETIFNHPNRYGIDIGHGTGAAMFGH